MNKKSGNDKGFLAVILLIFFINICFIMPYLIYDSLNQPLHISALKTGTVKTETEIKIFVGGSVEIEGYYNVLPTTTYSELFSRCGLTDYAYSAEYFGRQFIDFTADKIILNYITTQNQDFAVQESVDLNNSGTSLHGKLIFAGLTAESAEKITAFIIDNKAFKDKNELKSLIGETEFLLHHHKLFIY